MEFINSYESPLGKITLSSDGKNLNGLWFDGQKYDRKSLDREFIKKDLEVFDETKEWLDLYFKGINPGFLPPIMMKTSDFRKEVWEILLTIPYGETMTYGQIAKLMAKKRGLSRMSAQAVGGAVGHNAISIIIPCHRVLGADGGLTGYAGGTERKLKLLRLEGVNL